jgi:hypothetical protein
MTKKKINFGFKICATCNSWGGQKSVNINIGTVDYDTSSTGFCSYPWMAQKNADFSCSKWVGLKLIK